MRLLAPIILLIMTAIMASHEQSGLSIEITSGKDTITLINGPVLAIEEPQQESDHAEASGYDELVEAPGLLNRVTLFGY
jgi:hypothetical protein